MLAWHFVDGSLRDAKAVPDDGQALVHETPIALCRSGLHASERILDALKFAPGNTICRVECENVVDRQDDKLVCGSRTIVWRVDAEDALREFARQVALDVGDLWDMPDGVRKFLKSGNDNLRIAARAAARDASREHLAAGEMVAAAAGEAARAAAARTHAARATALAAAWAAAKARGGPKDDEAWTRYDKLLEGLVEAARQQDESGDEWGDFADEFEI